MTAREKAIAELRTSLAASQAEVRELREALTRWADANDELRRAHLLLGMEDKQASIRFRTAADMLMVMARRAPGSDAALREFGERCALAAERDESLNPAQWFSPELCKRRASEIVARILGEPKEDKP